MIAILNEKCATGQQEATPGISHPPQCRQNSFWFSVNDMTVSQCFELWFVKFSEAGQLVVR